MQIDSQVLSSPAPRKRSAENRKKRGATGSSQDCLSDRQESAKRGRDRFLLLLKKNAISYGAPRYHPSKESRPGEAPGVGGEQTPAGSGDRTLAKSVRDRRGWLRESPRAPPRPSHGRGRKPRPRRFHPSKETPRGRENNRKVWRRQESGTSGLQAARGPATPPGRA